MIAETKQAYRSTQETTIKGHYCQLCS